MKRITIIWCIPSPTVQTCIVECSSCERTVVGLVVCVGRKILDASLKVEIERRIVKEWPQIFSGSIDNYRHQSCVKLVLSKPKKEQVNDARTFHSQFVSLAVGRIFDCIWLLSEVSKLPNINSDLCQCTDSIRLGPNQGR